MRRLVVLYAITVFVNAALLFSVEPMFAKLALPLLGGTPSVWNTALVFFQTALLVGYAYAHATTRWLTLRQQVVVHVALATVSCVVALPLQLRTPGDPPLGGAAIPWLVLVFTLSLGLPFAVLASGAPLLQRWFAASDHPDAHDPYFLYAASNLGSLCALLGYPFLIEPWFTLATQREAWSVGYVVVMALVACCALWVRARARDERAAHVPTDTATATTDVVTAKDRARWVLFAAVPSSLLMGATTYVSTDVAAMPLLWVVPLALYLLTFVLAFAKRPPVPHAWMLFAERYLLVLALAQFYLTLKLPGLLMPVAFHFGMLFVVAMVCHGELARRRPSARWLTEFFLWISVGGLVGGVFNALVAPLVFDDVLEYALVLVIAGFLRPRTLAPESVGDVAGDGATARDRRLDVVLPVGLCLFLIVTALLPVSPQLHFTINAVALAAAAMLLIASSTRRVRFGLLLLAVFLASRVDPAGEEDVAVLRRDRSFFGVYRVTERADGALRTLIHGTTVHGTQWLDSARRLEPLTYYHRLGPMGDLFREVPAALAPSRRVAVVGLGIGSLACYGRAGERFTYYEIDPLIVEIARDTASFTLLRDCGPGTNVVLGDARLTLRDATADAYDVLVIDAFSSDAIPVHLLTREAFALYSRVLAPGGVLAVHISNRHVDLEPIVSALARDAGARSLVRHDPLRSDDVRRESGRSGSVWMLVAGASADFGTLQGDSLWKAPKSGGQVWTDDFSNVLRALKWR